MLNFKSPGIHHITMLAGDAQSNVDFYAGTLGMRIVKISVNQDDPGTYHFFYGDATGSPGSDITFFPYPGGRTARLGNGNVGEIRLAVPKGSKEFWTDRLSQKSVGFEEREDDFGDRGLSFADPDGLALRLVESNEPAGQAWPDMLVPADAAILKSVGVTILTGSGSEDTLDSKTSKFIEKYLGFENTSESGRVRRYTASDGTYLDVISEPRAPFGVGGHGGVHHIAFRAESMEAQDEIHEALLSAGVPVSEIIDRLWFRSIYFREPGGVLYEIATDGPGFTKDEPFETLGSKVSLPPWLEIQRELIERSLPKIEIPTAVSR